MTIHREGYRTLWFTFIAIVLFDLLFCYFIDNSQDIIFLVLIGSIISFLSVLQFFRSPSRTIPVNDKHILAPADGTVVSILEVMDDEYYNERRMQISVFMSPFNVHLNRYPISGEVKYTKYHKGKYLFAFLPKSSKDNEHTSIVIANGNLSILVRQIAGGLARRIIYYCNVGDKAEQGQELGFIKFGSRADVLLPLNSNILVKKGQRVKGGVTAIAEII